MPKRGSELPTVWKITGVKINVVLRGNRILLTKCNSSSCRSCDRRLSSKALHRREAPTLGVPSGDLFLLMTFTVSTRDCVVFPADAKIAHENPSVGRWK